MIQSLDIAVPVNGPAVGASVGTAKMAGKKTLTIEGAGDGVIAIEGTHDGSNFFPIVVFDILNDPVPKEILAVTFALRARRLSGSGAVLMTVSAEGPYANIFRTMIVPPNSTIGASSNLGQEGTLRTVAVIGRYSGTIGFEAGSDTDLVFDPVVTFNTQQTGFANFVGAYTKGRVRRYQTLDDGVPIVTCGVEGADQESCTCVCGDIYKVTEHFDTFPQNNPAWIINGNVSLLNKMGGAWAVETLAVPGDPELSLFTRAARTVAFAGNDGAIPNPPVHLQARVYIPDFGENTFFICGLVDFAHLSPDFPTLAAAAFDATQWFLFQRDGVNPPVLIPTGIPPGQSCESSTMFELRQLPNGNVSFMIDGIDLGNFPVPPGNRAHLYAPAAAAQHADPNNPAHGRMVVDYFCVSEGMVCLDDEGPSFFSPPGVIFQMVASALEADAQTNDPGNWVDLVVANLTARGSTTFLVNAAIASENDTVGERNQFRIAVNGVPIPFSEFAATADSANTPRATAIQTIKVPSVAAGANAVSIQWKVTGGVGSVLPASKPQEEHANLLVMEVAQTI